MSLTTLFWILLAGAAVVIYTAGRQRSLAMVNGIPRSLHSLPSYYGLYAALWCVAPAVLVIAVWTFAQSTVVMQLATGDMPAVFDELTTAEYELQINRIQSLAQGNIVALSDACNDATSQAYDSDTCLLQRGVQAAAGRYESYQTLAFFAQWVLVLVLAGLGARWALTRISPQMRARNQVEKAVMVFLIASSTVAIFTTLGIVLSVLFESMRFFRAVPVTEFLFGTQWSPQIALRADQAGASGAFGAVPLFAGTLLISVIAMLVAVPIGLMSALYLSEYAHPKFRASAKPILEILAGIPTVVYGFFAALTMAPLIREIGTGLGLDVASESALAAGLVMGVMIIPFVSSLSDDVINAVPQAMRDGSYALGSTHSETIKRVILPAALPGIVGGILLAVSRAIGETMIVVMAAGLSSNLTANPLEAVTTVTVQIVTLLTGDQEFDSPKTLAAFALGLVLFASTLVLNVIALHVVRKYREQYE